jgi:two-component system, NtrC family, sensor kinase
LPPDLIDQIFEPFVTTKEPGKGTGLGLALCARLIEGMGGVIHAGNAPTAAPCSG